MRRVVSLQATMVYLLGGGTISISYRMSMELMVLGRQKYI